MGPGQAGASDPAARAGACVPSVERGGSRHTQPTMSFGPGGRRRLVAMLAPTGRRACGHSVYKSIIWSNVVKRNLLFAATALALALSFSACSQQSTAAEEAASA